MGKKVGGGVKVGDKFMLNCGVLVEVINYYSALQIEVSDDQGNTKLVRASNLKAKSVSWDGATAKDKTPGGKFQVGAVGSSNRWGAFEVVEYNSPTDITIKFLNTGNVQDGMQASQLSSGRFKDRKAYAEKVVKPVAVGNYVYIAKHGDEVVYVGKGSGERYKHCTSGRSSSYYLNKLHFDGADVVVEIHKDRLTEEEADLLEKSMIASLSPKGNTLTYQ